MVTVDYNLGMNFIEGFMNDACVVTRVTRGYQDEVTDPVTGKVTEPTPVTVYTGKCSVNFVRTGDQEFVIGDKALEANVYKVLIPVDSDSGDLRIGDVLTVTDSLVDPSLVGRPMRVIIIDRTTHKTYRRIHVQDIEAARGSVRPS